MTDGYAGFLKFNCHLFNAILTRVQWVHVGLCFCFKLQWAAQICTVLPTGCNILWWLSNGLTLKSTLQWCHSSVWIIFKGIVVVTANRYSFYIWFDGRRQPGWEVSVSDSQSGGPGFESHFEHYLDLFLCSPEFKSSATLVNSSLVCLRPVGFLTILCSIWIWIIYFNCLLGPTSTCAMNTAEGKYRF